MSRFREAAPSIVLSSPEGRLDLKSGAGVSHLVDALQEALRAADPRVILKHALSLKQGVLHVDSLTLNLSGFDRILVIGGGKASGKMALGMEEILGDRIDAGFVSIPDYQIPRPVCRRIKIHAATHPIPSARGVAGVRRMLELVGRPTDKDLVICAISGGGSALLPLPAPGVTLHDVQVTTDLLLKSGAEISEVNTVRKHLSAIAGGRLAQRLYPATVLSLVISDVVGDSIDSIASGPTAPDRTTFRDAEIVLRNYGLWTKVTPGVREVISRGVARKLEETPKKGSKVFRRVHNLVVGSTRISCLAAAKRLREDGYSTVLLSTRIRGEARETGRLFASKLADMVEKHLPLRPPAAIVAGGETTVTVRGRGVGGRNQELALSAALEIEGMKNVYVASLGTDGVDGPTTAAGAIGDGTVVGRARMAGEEARNYLKDNDSNTFFRKFGGLLVTGPTGTNVNDVIIAMACGT